VNRLVIIPSAKKVSKELEIEIGDIPSGMIPIGGQPAIAYISDFYLSHGFKISVAVDHNKEEIIDYVSKSNLLIETINVKNSSSLGETLLKSIKITDFNTNLLVINFADTFSSFEIPDIDTIYYSNIEEQYRWTTFRLSKTKEIIQIKEKNIFNLNDKRTRIFTGIFVIKDIRKFKKLLEKHINNNDFLDPFYHAIQEYFNLILEEKKQFIELKKWHDFGHVDTYYSSRRNLFKRERAFNSISIDELRGILTKKSKNKSKLINEINWYRSLPDQLSYLSPKIYEFDVNSNNPFIKMEYYGYPVLSDIYLFGSWNPGLWSCFFKDLKFILTDMDNFNKSDDKEKIKRSLEEIYINKTILRLKEIEETDLFKKFNKNQLKINNLSCLSLSDIVSSLPETFKKLKIEQTKTFSIIHGDLCLSNILYDSKNRIVRLIDPRGSFGEYKIYGDKNYDIAKLQHSILGDYDFILNNLFDIEWKSDQEIFFSPHVKKRHLLVKEIFKQTFNFSETNKIQIDFIHALLFLSLVALHSDKPRSQEAFLANGVFLYSKVYNSL
jgi:hypothetical protein